MADIKKFLDQDGIQHLWSKISMEDYPNNETLIAVINAIDETKSNKDEVLLKAEQELTTEEIEQVHKNLKLENLATDEPEYTSIILKSSTPGSIKKFKLTVDDDGILITEEVVE